MRKKALLLILDGWGMGDKTKSDAIFHAKTPNFDSIMAECPSSTLKTFGENVGLPEGQMGNSEVGHINIGAGRVVYQDFVRVNRSIEDGTLAHNKTLLNTFEYCERNDKTLHLMGLVSDGGIHSHINHVIALCKYASEFGLKSIAIHAFTDGRDTDPRSGLGFIERLKDETEMYGAKICSIIGRYYAMDRDNRWERIKLAYDLMTKGKGEGFFNPIQAMNAAYEKEETDEFITPKVITDKDGKPISPMQEGDAVICFNFRTDRCRQITKALTQENFQEHGMNTIDLEYVTLTRYDENFKGINIVFETQNLSKTLGEVLAENGKKQLRMAETEKYPHVTFFFSGGAEEPFAGEKRIMVNSPKIATYDLKPEMSAYELKDKAIEAINSQEFDFICLNFANPDMVGHTGVYNAIVKALEATDECLGEVLYAAEKNEYPSLVIADHGNAELTINPDGSPNTAHTTNLVPCILVHSNKSSVKDGILADIAPAVLRLMDVPQPPEMTGKTLV